tara:strand:+ start:803 stop:1066 length:264 start_codon:yes stop_codon:yes gene_type:complete
MRPCNRYILINPISEEEEHKTTVLVPDSYVAKKSSYLKAHVLDWAEDVKISLHENAVVIVNSGMVEEIDLGGEKYHLILENYVLGHF